MTQVEFSVPHNHPALPGHFPGHPIVPGVVILDAVIRAVESAFPGGSRILGAPAIKFLAPLLPGETAQIQFAAPDNNLIRFTVTRGSTPLASGQLTLQT